MADLLSYPTVLVLLVLSAFALPLVFVGWIRNTERYGREPLRAVLRVFGWGAFVSAVIAIILEFVFLAAAMQIGPLYTYLASRFSDPTTVFAILVVAPFVEEATKGLGVLSARRRIRTTSDGLVYGATAGFGFSAMETLFYGGGGMIVLINEGLDPTGSILVIVVRSFSSSLLHASATATTGFGLAKGWLWGRRYAYVPFYFLAVGLHATFNFLQGLPQLYPGFAGGLTDYVGFFAAVVFAVTALTLVRFKLLSRRPSAAR